MLKLDNKRTFEDVCGDTLVIDSFENYHKTKYYMTFECETSSSFTSIFLNESNVETLQNFLRSIDFENITEEYILKIDNKIDNESITFAIGSYPSKRTYMPYLYIEIDNPTTKNYTLVEFDKSLVKVICDHMLSF